MCELEDEYLAVFRDFFFVGLLRLLRNDPAAGHCQKRRIDRDIANQRRQKKHEVEQFQFLGYSGFMICDYYPVKMKYF
jgi:hypothetical protein